MIRSSFIFKENLVFFQEKDNSSEKVFIVEEGLDGVDVDSIRNLVDLTRLVLIDEECWNLKVVIDGVNSWV